MNKNDIAHSRLLLTVVVVGLLLAVPLSAPGVSRSGSAAPQACVPGPHTGTLAADETWCKADSPHVVNVQFTVAPGVTLSIEPGVTVMTSPHWRDDFLVQGHLEALGTPTEPIIFTSTDDTAPGQWSGLAFDGGTGHLRHVMVRYAGKRNSVTDAGEGHWCRASIAVHNVRPGEVRLENVTIRDIATSDQDLGLYVDDSNIIVEDSLFTGIGNGSHYDFPDAAIYISGGDSDVALTDNTFTANDSNTIFLRPGAMMNHDTVLVAQDGLAGYVLDEGFTVPPTVTLTIEPGVTVKGNSGGNHSGELRVEGHLEALGTATEPITFTSFDDSAPAQWCGLVFDGTSGAGTGHLRYATVRYGGIGNSVLKSIPSDYHSGSNITVYNVGAGEVRLEHVTVESEYHFDGWHKYSDHGLYVHDSHVAVVDSIIQDNCDGTDGASTDSGVFVIGDSQVTIEDSLIQSNSGPGLLVEGDTAFVKVTGSAIVNNIGDGVRSLGTATLILSGDGDSGNSIHSNQGFGANQKGENGLTMAGYNWWGDASGPTHAGNPGGVGEGVTDRVLYDPWLIEAPVPPTVAASMVQLAAPNRVSVGQTVNLGLLFQNLHTETLEDAILVLEIPWRAEYLYSTDDGQFWALHNRVIWKLGDVAPGATFDAIAQIRFLWHTPDGTGMPAAAMVAADNLRNPWVTYEEHLAYEELVIANERELDQAEVDGILANDAVLNALYQDALALGFGYYGNAVLLTLDDATEWFEMLLMDLDRPGEVLAVRRIGEDRHIRHEADTYLTQYTLSGGSRFDYLTAEWEFWGDLAPGTGVAGAPEGQATWNAFAPDACPHHNWGDCLRNCLLDQIPREMSKPSLFAGLSACRACEACDEFCLGVCSDCARELWQPHQHEHYHDCTKECADSSNWNNYQCDKDRVECYAAPRNESRFGRSEYRLTYVCDKGTCKYKSNPTLEYCPHGCAVGDTAGSIVKTECVDCEDFWDFITEAQCIRALTAHDPNALYGPEAAAPGQIIEYTVEWENEGKGTAYGVYAESTLPAELDESTLQIDGGGTYFAGSRTLLWQIGELGPGEGDSVSYRVQVPVTAISGTLMLAEANVYFPSVPETTPTNPIVTIVQDLVANGQQVTTDRGMPVAITLSGYSPSGNPLEYTILDQPLNGSLTGTPPNVTYTPAAAFEGLDGFKFMVKDGLNRSLPAVVTVIVNAPPRVYLPLVFRNW